MEKLLTIYCTLCAQNQQRIRLVYEIQPSLQAKHCVSKSLKVYYWAICGNSLLYNRYRYHYEIFNLPIELPWALSQLHSSCGAALSGVLTLHSVLRWCYHTTKLDCVTERLYELTQMQKIAHKCMHTAPTPSTPHVHTPTSAYAYLLDKYFSVMSRAQRNCQKLSRSFGDCQTWS